MTRRALPVVASVAASALASAACARPSGSVAPADGAVVAPPAVRVIVAPDDGMRPLLDFIDSARRQLDVYVFDLGSDRIERRILDAVRQGVRVRAIVEPNAAGRIRDARETMASLRRGGVAVKPAGRPFSKTHAKALVADSARAWIGTGNFVEEWDERRDYAAVTERPDTVAALARIFEEDWRGTATAVRLPTFATADQRTGLVVSPTHGRAAVTAFLSGAQRSIFVEHDKIEDDAVADVLARRSRAGVDVQVVVSDDEVGRAAARALQQRSSLIQVRVLAMPHVHAKLVVVDEERVLLGSQNLTKDSLDTRREIGIVVDEPEAVAKVLSTFRRDFDNTPDAAGDGAAARVARLSRLNGSFFAGFGSGAGVTAAAGVGWWLWRRVRREGE